MSSKSPTTSPIFTIIHRTRQCACTSREQVPVEERLEQRRRARRKEIDLPQIHSVVCRIQCSAPHLNPVEHTFNLVRNLLRRKKAWTEEELMDSLTELFNTESFSQEGMTRLFKSGILGGPNPGERLKL